MPTWVATDGADSGQYRGCWLALFSVVTTEDIPADAIWSPMANASDNRTDGTGMFLELDLYDGDPGQVGWVDYSSRVGAVRWDHSDRNVVWVGRDSDGTVDDSNSPGVLIPSGTTIYLVAQQWPDGLNTPLPLDAAVDWDPATDTGSWTLADGVTPLLPWDNADLVEITITADGPPAPPANDNWGADQAIVTDEWTAGDVTDASNQLADEPVNEASGDTPDLTVWFFWTSGPTGDAEFKVVGGGDGVTLDVYTCDDGFLSHAVNVGSGVTGMGDGPDVVVTVTAGGTGYYIRVGCLPDAAPEPFHVAVGYDLLPFGDRDGGTSIHHHTASVFRGTHVTTRTGTGWASNLRQRTATVTVSIGDTDQDGVTFTADALLLDGGDVGPHGPYAHSILKAWLAISDHPEYDEHHQVRAGTWPAEEHHGDWGHYRIHVGTKNVTTFRGAQTIVMSMSETDPFGYANCSLLFPMIGPHEQLGPPGSDTHWLPGDDDDKHIPVIVHHVLPDGTLAGRHFEGDIDKLVDNYDGRTGALQVDCIGTLYTLDDRITKPRFTSDPIDIGRFIHELTKYEAKYGWHGHPCPDRHTGIKTAERGGFGDPLMSTTIQNLLAQAQRDEGEKWTLMPRWPRGMHMQVRDLDTVHFTVWCGQPGVTHNLTRDLAHAVRAIFGEGQDHDVQFWRNTQYPNALISPPSYPLAPSVLFTPGSGHTGLTPFSEELHTRGYHLDSGDTYQASDEDTIRKFQTDAGILIDGVIGPQTWAAAFTNSENANALYAYIRPLAVASAAEPFRYNGRGGIIGRNPDYDHRTRREKLEQFGTLAKSDARRSAHLELPIIAHADYAGSVTLTNIDPPERGALSIHAGMNFLFKGHRGADRKLHVAKIDKDPGMQAGRDRVVTLTSSERGDDYVTLAARMQRNRDVVDLSGRRRPSHRRSRHTPDFAPWDSESGAGFLKPQAQYAGLWNVYPIPAGELGTITHVRLVATVGTTIAAAIFNRKVTVRELTRLPGLADPGGGSAGGQDPWTVNKKTLTRTLKFRHQPWMAWATGGPGAMQGYWPHDPAAGATRTGVLDDSASFDFHSARPPWLWLAVWTRDSCRISGDPDYDHRVLFPGPPPQ